MSYTADSVFFLHKLCITIFNVLTILALFSKALLLYLKQGKQNLVHDNILVYVRIKLSNALGANLDWSLFLSTHL